MAQNDNDNQSSSIKSQEITGNSYLEVNLNSGTIFSWGLGKEGQLGSGQFKNEIVPHHAVSFLKKGTQYFDETNAQDKKSTVLSKQVVQIGTGGLFSAALLEDGTVYTCGCGKSGRLGHGTDNNEAYYRLVEAIASIKVAQIACGDWHMAVRTVEGDIITWGHSKNGGGLGHGRSADGMVPRKVKDLEGKQAKFVTAGHNLTAVITGADELYLMGSWMGSGSDGLPWKVSFFDAKKVTGVACGNRHMLIIADGQVYAWGHGATGLGPKIVEVTEPHVIPSLTGRNVTQVSCNVGEHHPHCAAVTAAGELFTWGSGYKGKLGHGDTEDRHQPAQVSTACAIVSVSCGGIHTGAIDEQGKVLTFGCGSDGRLGHPEVEGHRYLYKEYSPREVDALGKYKALQISCSYYHTVALVQ